MPEKPNILIVMTDHQRADTILPGGPAITPNLDKLMKKGITFTNTYCPTAHCCPSRATFMSGLYPSRHGIWNNVLNGQAINTELAPGVKLWSEDLAEYGYSMHYSGKWHVSGKELPRDRGWNEMATVSAIPGITHHGITWDEYGKLPPEHDLKERGSGEIRRPGYPSYKLYDTMNGPDESHDRKVTTESCAKIRELAGTSDPWCIFTGFIGPHDPYVIPRKFLDLYSVENIRLPVNYSDEMVDKPYIYRRIRNQIWNQLPEKEIKEGIRHYLAYCSYLDALSGELFQALDDSGQDRNTVVIYCSDHGDYCGDHGLFCKGIHAFNGAYHVPAVISWPEGVENPGRKVDGFVSLADFAPTLLELAGIKTDRYFTGCSLMQFLNDSSPGNWRDDIHTQFNGVELYYSQRSVKTAEFKYVFNGYDRDELYNLTEDPHEMINVEAEPKYQDIKKDMVKRMWKFARMEDDSMINPYITVGLAPWGPGEIFK